MTFEEYRIKADVVAQYPGRMDKDGIVYCLMGLGGESGELLEKIKKIYRDKNGTIDEEAKDWLIQEIGDVLWYCSQIYSELRLPFENFPAIPNNIKEIKDFQNYIDGDFYDKERTIQQLIRRGFFLLYSAGRLLGDHTYNNKIKKENMTVILYNLVSICIETGISLEHAASANIEKLYSRKERGKLQGSGDNR